MSKLYVKKVFEFWEIADDDTKRWNAYQSWLSYTNGGETPCFEEFKSCIYAMETFFQIRINDFHFGGYRSKPYIDWEPSQWSFRAFSYPIGVKRLMAWLENHVVPYGTTWKTYRNAKGKLRISNISHHSYYDFYHDSWGLFTTIFTSMMNDLRKKNVFSLLISVEEFITAFCSRILEAYREEEEYFASEQYFFDNCADLYDYDDKGQIIPESVICSMEEWKGDLSCL